MRDSCYKTSSIFAIFAAAITLVAVEDLGAVWQDGESQGQASKATQAGKPEATVYIVQMSEEPVATYQGGDSRFAATKPEGGNKIEFASSSVVSYAAHLKSQHARVLAQSKGG